jgi:hypothetical protein
MELVLIGLVIELVILLGVVADYLRGIKKILTDSRDYLQEG